MKGIHEKVIGVDFSGLRKRVKMGKYGPLPDSRVLQVVTVNSRRVSGRELAKIEINNILKK